MKTKSQSESKSTRISRAQSSKLKKAGLKLAIEEIRVKTRESGLTEEDVMNEVWAVRRSRGIRA